MGELGQAVDRERLRQGVPRGEVPVDGHARYRDPALWQRIWDQTASLVGVEPVPTGGTEHSAAQLPG